MYPDWILFLNSGLGLIGILIGIRVIRLKTKIRTGIIIEFLILLLGGLIKIIFSMY